MRKRNMEYEGYIWKKLAKEELARELNIEPDTDSIPAEEIEARAFALEAAFEEATSESVEQAAEIWLKGFERMANSVEAGLPEGARETMIFSILGSNLLVHLCEKLSVNTEHLTIEDQRDAAAMVREFSKIFMWIGGNVQELYKDTPNAN
jgi:hypothetical protein